MKIEQPVRRGRGETTRSWAGRKPSYTTHAVLGAPQAYRHFTVSFPFIALRRYRAFYTWTSVAALQPARLLVPFFKWHLLTRVCVSHFGNSHNSLNFFIIFILGCLRSGIFDVAIVIVWGIKNCTHIRRQT